MTALINQSSTLPSRSDLFYFLVGMICTAGVWATALVDVIWAQTQRDPKPPTQIEGDARAGKVLFNQHCVTCHGPKGRGDGLEIAGATVADLSSPTTQRKLNVDLLTTIHEGRPGRVMPSWEYRLSQEQTRDVLAYIRTLRRK
jgi:mono/diheme cytochrome c family protein